MVKRVPELRLSDVNRKDVVESKMIKNKLVALLPGGVSRSDIFPLLIEHLSEEKIVCIGLLDGISDEEIHRLYAPSQGENTLRLRRKAQTTLVLSAERVEAGLQKRIRDLEAQGAETILLLNANAFENLRAGSAVLLEPRRIVPPMIEAIVNDHQAGIIVAADDAAAGSAHYWRRLSKRPHFAVASPWEDEALIDAALALQEKGADVLILDCLGYHQRHRDFLQKLLGIPVLLSHLLIVKLAAELVM